VLRTCILLIAAAGALHAQDVAVYSEFQRFDPLGRPLVQDRDLRAREILSPAVPRNGHISVNVVVTAPAHTNYFLYAISNPPGVLGMTLYQEHFVPCGTNYCPDGLTETRAPTFGAMPESALGLPDQIARCYLLDIYVPPGVTPRHIRVEVLLKTGIWIVAPMELRVIEPTVPEPIGVDLREDVAAPADPAGATAQRQLFRFMDGLPPEFPPAILTVRDAIQRNAAEDMLLARSAGLRVPELNLLAWSPFVFPELGAEWYLRVRDFIYRWAY
jgi:hypothetical protein